MELGRESIESILARMSAAEPGPAAGSAAALALGMAAALVGKTARLSARQLPDADRMVDRSDQMRAEALLLAGADAEVVIAMLTGAKPESTVEVPRQIQDLAAELADTAARLAADGNPRLRADAVVARLLAEAAVAGCAEIVRE